MVEQRRHRLLRTLAERQFQVLTIAQIRELGFSDDEITTMLGVLLHRRHRGIYVYATERPPQKGALLAAQWSCGVDAYLSGRTALALAGLRGLYLGSIEIAVPRQTIRRRERPIALRRCSRDDVEVREDGPLRIATIPDALLDAAARGASVSELTRLITEAIHARKLDHGRMRGLISGARGRVGIIALSAAYRAYLPRPSARSELERSFDRRLATRPDIPAPEPNVRIEAAGIRWEVDRYWAKEQVGVELNGGGYHHAASDVEKDGFKAAKLALLGIQLIAFTDTRWELEPDACLDDLGALLAQRRRRPVA